MDFTKICRLCLEEKASLRNENDSLQDIFSQILQIEIYEDDQLPQQLCEECITTVTKLDETIRTYRDNDEKLRKLLYESGHVMVKQELAEMEAEYLLEPEIELAGNEQKEAEEVDQLESSENSTKKVDVKVQPVKKRKKDKKKDQFPVKPIKGDIRCYVCRSAPFDTPEALLVHLVEHSGELPYTCTLCVRSTVVITNVSTLNVHKRMHDNPTPCPHCDSRFSNKSSLDLHLTMKHQDLAPDATPSNCTECGKLFLTKKALRWHMNSHDPPTPCEVCGKVFKSKKLLGRHVSKVHEKAEQVECHICHKKLVTLTALRAHLSTMHSTEQFQCKYCPRLYPSKTSLTYHEKQHELKPNYTETMSNHWRQYYTVEGEKGSEVRTCTLCGLVLGKAIGKHYTNKHFPQAKRDHRCDQCSAVFRHKKDLEVHVLEHTHGKFLKCPICGKEFAEKRYLVWHMKTKKHKDHPLAQSLDWIESDLPAPSPNLVEKKEEVREERVIVEAIIPDQTVSYRPLMY
uniref:Zinc finger protein 567 n=2 Tax=Culex pipiens TaxID=7175 RepID=A0A8D8CU77_CULPI